MAAWGHQLSVTLELPVSQYSELLDQTQPVAESAPVAEAAVGNRSPVEAVVEASHPPMSLPLMIQSVLCLVLLSHQHQSQIPEVSKQLATLESMLRCPALPHRVVLQSIS